MNTTTVSLKERYETYKKEHPKKRIRAAAQDLGVSEMELLACYVGEHVTRLNDDFKGLLKEVHRLGRVMALTRNEFAVHERKGVYDNISFMKGAHNMGLAVNPDIDLRLFMNAWVHGFAVTVQSRGKDLHGFQFFNAYGEAVHKIYLTNKSNAEVYFELVEQFKHEDQSTGQAVSTEPKSTPEYVSDEEVDLDEFQREWREMEDTHHFFGMLRRYKVARTQALRLAPEGYTQRVDNQAAIDILKQAAAQELPIMVFVGSEGCIQIHTGEVNKLLPMGSWFNVMDPMFNLHLDMDGVAESWVVKKSTEDGIVTSLELFDAEGNQIVQFFGKRKPGIPELEGWREIVATLE